MGLQLVHLVVLIGMLLSVGANTVLAATITPPALSQDGENLVMIRLAGGEEIRVSDIRKYAQRRTDLKALLNTPTGWSSLVEEIAMTRALVLEGERRQEKRSGDIDPNIDPRFDDIYALAVYRKIAGECKAPVGDAEARQYYDANPQAFKIPAQARIERVILPKALMLDKFPAEQWLGLQARAVAMSSARFEALIQRATEAAPDLRQGDLGWISLEGAEAQPVLGAIQNAGKGGLVGPLGEGDYVYLLHVKDWRDAQLLPWEFVKHQVPTRAVQYCRETQRERVKTELFKRYEVQIDGKALRAVGATGN
ncbi:MAG: peptidylprolyl isomerase [Tepidimonas sp.]|nr:peptidylprolyl isomerase [Tepidimonas sp.]